MTEDEWLASRSAPSEPRSGAPRGIEGPLFFAPRFALDIDEPPAGEPPADPPRRARGLAPVQERALAPAREPDPAYTAGFMAPAMMQEMATENGACPLPGAGEWGAALIFLAAPGGAAAVFVATKGGPRQAARVVRLTSSAGPDGANWAVTWPDDSCPVASLPGENSLGFYGFTAGCPSRLPVGLAD